MSDTTVTETPTVTATDVAKTFGKAVTKELAYQAGVHVAALTVLMAIGYTYSKVQERRRRAKKATPAPVEE
jgi:hypothetical protein